MPLRMGRDGAYLARGGDLPVAANLVSEVAPRLGYGRIAEYVLRIDAGVLQAFEHLRHVEVDIPDCDEVRLPFVRFLEARENDVGGAFDQHDFPAYPALRAHVPDVLIQFAAQFLLDVCALGWVRHE